MKLSGREAGHRGGAPTSPTKGRVPAEVEAANVAMASVAVERDEARPTARFCAQAMG